MLPIFAIIEEDAVAREPSIHVKRQSSQVRIHI